MLQRVSPIIATIRPIGNMAPFLIAVNSALQISSVIEIDPTLRVFVAKMERVREVPCSMRVQDADRSFGC